MNGTPDPTDTPPPRTADWGAVAFGSMAGIGFGLGVFVILGIVGVTSGRSTAILVFLNYLSLFVAGYVAARFGAANPVLNGSIASLVVLAVTTVLTTVTSEPLALSTLWVLVIVAAVIGAAGAVLAASGDR